MTDEPSNIYFGVTPTAKNSSAKETIAYICSLRTRIECEPVSEHSTRSDRATNIGYGLFSGASPLPSANPNLSYKMCCDSLFFFRKPICLFSKCNTSHKERHISCKITHCLFALTVHLSFSCFSSMDAIPILA